MKNLSYLLLTALTYIGQEKMKDGNENLLLKYLKSPKILGGVPVVLVPVLAYKTKSAKNFQKNIDETSKSQDQFVIKKVNQSVEKEELVQEMFNEDIDLENSTVVDGVEKNI
jgi:hypothetical protein